ncbi:MAG: class I SAM-dependent methyltransferase [Mangrovicoccus sp.]
MTDQNSLEHSEKMDKVYEWQVKIYDLTRKYYLLGRDHLIDHLDPAPGSAILEVACGTGRNLVQMARRYPECHLYGIDISNHMIEHAKEKITAAGLSDRISLAWGDACAFDPQPVFGRTDFDQVVFSYSLSMIPDWPGAMRQGLKITAPDGRMSLVDFGQQDGLPRWFRKGLYAWLDKFHVTPRAEMDDVLKELAVEFARPAQITSLYRDYAHFGQIGPKT